MCGTICSAHRGEAQAVIAPVVKLQRGLFARNHDDYRQHVELASALYASALAGAGDRRALLAEASVLIAGLPTEMRSFKTVVLWRERIRVAVLGGAAAAGSGARAGSGAAAGTG